MENKNIKLMCQNALIAALYFVLQLLFSYIPLSMFNDVISFRIAEALVAIVIFNKKYIPGVVIGCFLSNILEGNIDIIIGPIQSLLSCLVLYYFKRKHLAIFIASLLCGLIIGLEYYILGLSIIGLWIIATIFISEYVVLLLGYFIFRKMSTKLQKI